VLPLACRAGDDDLEFFTEDLTDEITIELSRDGYFKVIAGGTMAAWRGRQIDHRVVGRELGARYLIDGKVQRAGGQMRLTLQLIEAETTSMLWSEKYPCAEDDLDRREAMVGGIAAHLTELIVHLEMARAVKQTGDLTAWDHILRAMNGGNRASRESIRMARNDARQAVAIAPDFGLAHASLAANLGILTLMFGADEEVDPEEIRRHIKRAHELDGENPLVLRNLASACTRIGAFEQGLRFAERAAALNRNSTHSQLALAFAYLALGRTSDAIAAFTEQERLAPYDGLRYASLGGLGVAHYLEGRPQDALAALERSLTLHPNYVPALRLKAIVAKTLGDERVAHESLAKLREVEPGATLEWAMKGLAQAFDDKSLIAEAQAVLRALWAEAPS
jgi:TolB-like protein